MNSFIEALRIGVTVLGTGGLLFMAIVAIIALTAVFGQTAARRFEARVTLRILLHRLPPHGKRSGG